MDKWLKKFCNVYSQFHGATTARIFSSTASTVIITLVKFQ